MIIIMKIKKLMKNVNKQLKSTFFNQQVSFDYFLKVFPDVSSEFCFSRVSAVKSHAAGDS